MLPVPTAHAASSPAPEPEPAPAPAAVPLADGFDFPVGPPDAEGYYDAQSFGRNHHLGEDWNGVNGGDSDLGDPVHAVAAGVVRVASDLKGGWGRVVRIEHRYREGEQELEVESLYAHLHAIDVDVGEVVTRGQRIGAIGDAHGQYYAHLHLELRDTVGMPLGPGYSEHTAGYLAPTPFLRAHRAVDQRSSR